jgi:hypothetical protein
MFSESPIISITHLNSKRTDNYIHIHPITPALLQAKSWDEVIQWHLVATKGHDSPRPPVLHYFHPQQSNLPAHTHLFEKGQKSKEN